MSNPYAEGNPYGSNSASPVAPTNTDTQWQQSLMSQDPDQGDTLSPQQENSPTTSSLICLECLSTREWPLGKIAAVIHCGICGSTNVMVDDLPARTANWLRYNANNEFPQYITFSTGVVGTVMVNDKSTSSEDAWVWEVRRGTQILEWGKCQTSDQAKRLCEGVGPIYAIPVTVGSKTAGDDSNPFASGQSKPDAAPSDDKTPPSSDNASTSDALPKADDQQPPTDDQQSQDPMDLAQQQIDQDVAAAAALGHDPLEIAYDVDALTSSWRCSLCELEGDIQVDESGQVTENGDLFAGGPCEAAAQQPQDPNQPQETVPSGEQPPAATDVNDKSDSIAPQDQQINTNSKKRNFFSRLLGRRSASQVISGVIPVEQLKQGDMVDLQGDQYADDGSDTSLEFEYKTVDSVERETPDCTVVHFEDGDYGFPVGHPVTVVTSTLRRIEDDIRQANPGLSDSTLRTVATKTLREYPSLLR